MTTPFRLTAAVAMLAEVSQAHEEAAAEEMAYLDRMATAEEALDAIRVERRLLRAWSQRLDEAAAACGEAAHRIKGWEQERQAKEAR